MKKALFLLIIILLVLPGLQKELFHIPERSLKGAVVNSEKPEFSFSGWWSGDYQDKYDKYLEDHIGFRNFLVRLNNQIDYSLFNQINAQGVTVGKEGYLYELNYIRGYLGMDFLGQEILDEKIKQIEFTSQWLKEQGTVLICAFAPGKGRFYPEYFPSPYDTIHPAGYTNYGYYTEKLSTDSVEIIDFNALFLNWKDTSKYILYPRYGIHWSTYGVGLAIDTLIRRIESLLNKDITDFDWQEVVITDDLRYDDYDIADGMNLLCKLPCDEMAYPRFRYNEEGKYKPKILVIADSFFWQILGQGHAKRVFSGCDFWYYYSQAFHLEDGVPPVLDKAHLPEKLKEYDVVMTLYTEANLPKMANGFYEDVFYAVKYSDQIAKNIERIRNAPEWLAEIEKKATERGISLEDMLWLDALWLVKNANK
ncbi:MAG: hypothetical protein KKA81_06255 [Bacteroidetes bacterium]|nr:hypothetical protein [Bacteroidota bacterium]